MAADNSRGLFRQLEDALKDIDKLNAKIRKLGCEHECEIAAIRKSFRKEITELKKMIRDRGQIIADLTDEKEQLAEDGARLKSIVSRLQKYKSNHLLFCTVLMYLSATMSANGIRESAKPSRSHTADSENQTTPHESL